MIIPAFIERCDSYCERSGMSRARLSTILFNDGKRIDAVAAGSNVGVLTLQSAAKKLDEMETASSTEDAA